MQLPVRTALGFEIALLAVLQCTGCAQKSAPQRTFADQVALRLAKADLIGEAFSIMDNGKMLMNVDLATVIQPLEESLDLQAARILVHGSTDQAALESSARLFNETFQKHTKDLAQMWDLRTPNSHFTPQFMDSMLSDAASSKDRRNKDDPSSSDLLERGSLELLNSCAEKAALVKQTATLLPALRSQETLTIVEQLRAALSQAIARHPEHLKPFNEEKPPSQAIQSAIAKLHKLLEPPAGAR